MSKAHYALLNANIALRGSTELVAGYAASVACIDAAAIALARGKWLYGRATGESADFAAKTAAAADLQAACDQFAVAIEWAERALRADDAIASRAQQTLAGLRHNGTRIWWAEETPLVPSICPILVLTGSSRDIGRQYAQQCIDLFGRFVFETLAARSLNAHTSEIVEAWRTQLAIHTPEVLEMAVGIREGAARYGIALSERHALSLWTGLLAPARRAEPIGVLDAEGGGVMGRYFSDAAEDATHEGLCSGAAAWGNATPDGLMHFAASTDHDCTFQATLLVYPDDGHPFIYTPFSVNGSIPGVGRFGFAGHPGFNTAGLAYVHHGGGGACCELPETWGYGVPRGASSMHLLRYGSSTPQALQWEMAAPVGDVGRILGHPGGFYADATQAHVIESRDRERPLVRHHTLDRQGQAHDLLFATNNVQSPAARSPMYPLDCNFGWTLEEGWYSRNPAAYQHADTGVLTRRLWALSSAARNRYLHRELLKRNGTLDAATLLSLYRRGPQRDARSWAELEGAMREGATLPASVGHRLNAFVAAGCPHSRTYLGGVGPMTHRSATPNHPGHGYFYYDETSTYWQLTLGDSFRDCLAAARSLADALCAEAGAKLRGVTQVHDGIVRLRGFLDEACRLARCDDHAIGDDDDSAMQLGRTLSALCQSQVRARQVIEALSPPAEWNIN